MARDAVTLTALSLNGNAATPAGTTIDPANDASIDVGGNVQGVFLRVTNTHTSAHDATIVASTAHHATRGGLGDLTVEIPADTGDILIGPLDGSRFVQADGKIYVNFATGHAGKISAFRVSDDA